MPRPHGRDRLEPAEDGTVVLLSLRPKGWAGRPEAAPRAPVLPGTAVRWDGELWEVLRVEPRAGGGFRHVLAPWDDRFLVRTVAAYGEEPEAPAAVPAPVPLEEAPEEAPPPPAPRAVPAAAAAPPRGPGLAGAWRALPPAWRTLAVAFVPSVLLGWFFPFRVMGEGISFLVHELGHTLVAWFFGCSAMPAVVMTIVFAQSLAVAAIVQGALVFLAVKYRHAPRWNVLFAAVALVYPFLAFTKGHLVAFDLAGHLAEAAFAAWAFRRAVDGERPEWEGPVWAFFAFYLVARNVTLFGGVAFSAAARTDYLTVAIAGQNDLVKVAARTGVALPALAFLTALVCLVVPLASLALALRERKGVEAGAA
jgi:hypothetical protein